MPRKNLPRRRASLATVKKTLATMYPATTTPARRVQSMSTPTPGLIYANRPRARKLRR